MCIRDRYRKCSELLENIGGLGEGYSLHQWEDIVPIKLDEWRKENEPEVVDKEEAEKAEPQEEEEAEVELKDQDASAKAKEKPIDEKLAE